MGPWKAAGMHDSLPNLWPRATRDCPNLRTAIFRKRSRQSIPDTQLPRPLKGCKIFLICAPFIAPSKFSITLNAPRSKHSANNEFSFQEYNKYFFPFFPFSLNSLLSMLDLTQQLTSIPQLKPSTQTQTMT